MTAAREGSIPFDPPKTLPISNCRLPIGHRGEITLWAALTNFIATPIDNRQLAIINVRNCGREVRHLIVDQADDGSSPFSSANFNHPGVAQLAVRQAYTL